MERPLQLKSLWFGIGYALLLIVAVLSLMPLSEEGIQVNDKLAHFLIYGVLSAWFSLIVSRPRSLIYIFFGLIAFGLLIEYLQGLTDYRSAELADGLANSLGVLAGLAFHFSGLRKVLGKVDVGLQCFFSRRY